jgi:formylglycine-generating enzyme required for sulfatase activity
VVSDYVRWASGLHIELGETRITAQTDCGPRAASVEAQRSALHPSALDAAQDRLSRLQQQTTARSASGRDYSSSGSTMLWIPAGTFTMGCTGGQVGRCEPDEGPDHTVHISEGFWLEQTETSQRQWREVVGSPHASASASCGELCPVVSLSWCEAVTFANARSRKEGLQPAYLLPWSREAPIGPRCAEQAREVQWERSASGYRLPTEAEWEYAARAGGDTPYSGGTEPGALAWYDANGAQSTHPGGQKAPNAWGLHDMSGNAWEWVWDGYSGYGPDPLTDPSGPTWGTDRVKRGGGYSSQALHLRVAARDSLSPQVVSDSLGFRLARGATGMQPYGN